MRNVELYEERPANFVPKAEVAICFIHVGDQYLFLKKRLVFPGQWCVPGGRLEKGEAPKEAVVRELHEETSIKLENPVFLKILYVDNPSTVQFTLHCFSEEFDTKPNCMLNHEHSESTWCTLKESAKMDIMPGQAEIIDNLCIALKSC